MNVFSCLSPYTERNNQTRLLEELVNEDSLQVVTLIISDKNLNVKCRQKIAEAVIEQQRRI